MPIKFLMGRQVYDATGVPTVEVDMVTELGLFRVGVPSTDEKKASEAVQLRDNIPEELNGLSVNKAVKNINNIIAPELIQSNFEVTMQQDIDSFLVNLDGTENLSRLGANALMAISMVVAKAAAAKKGVPLYRYFSELGGITSIVLPVPHFTILTGGILASNGLPLQEYGIMPTGASSFAEAMRMGCEIYMYVKNVIQEKFGIDATYVSDNGGFAAPLQNHRDGLLLLMDAIKECGYATKVEIFLNASGKDMFKDGGYDLDFKNSNSNPLEYVSPDKLSEIYLDNIKEFSICSIQDPFDLDDWAAWSQMTARSPSQLLANDLTQTNTWRVGLALEKKAGNAATLLLNQVGTLSEVIQVFKTLKANNFGICVSDRWGDTEDLFLADMAVGLSVGQIKCGAPARCERVGKYNQILRIEEELGASAKYAGKAYRGTLTV